MKNTNAINKTELMETIELEFRMACLNSHSPYVSDIARYMMPADFKMLLKKIAADLLQKHAVTDNSMPTIKDIVDHLKKRLLIQIVGEAVPNSRKKVPPFWLLLRGGGSDAHNPYELLAAINRKGAVSHYSALQFHQLTTLQLETHFLTVPVKKAIRNQQQRPPASSSADDSTSTKTQSKNLKTGTECFTFNGLSFRTKQEIESSFFGQLKKSTDHQEFIQVFDVERTLLHTLSDPACNGGIRGITEAWERSKEFLDAGRIVEYLHKLGIPALWRKAGAMADFIDSPDLSDDIKKVVRQLPHIDDPFPLIWSRTTKGTLSKPWNVIVPW